MDEVTLKAKIPTPLPREGEIFLTDQELWSLTVRLEPFMQHLLRRVQAQHHYTPKTWTLRRRNALGLVGTKLCWGPLIPHSND